MRDSPGSPIGVSCRAVLAAAALILTWQLLLAPVVGVANNGDFGKLLGRFGLGTTDVFEYANTRYTFNDSYRYESGYLSSELLVIVPALAINRVLSKDGSFDIRIMGVLHGALFLLALFLFVPLLDGTRRWAAATVCVLALALFGDFLYVGYLNTFYMDVPTYLFLLLAVVFYLRAIRWGRRWDALGVVGSGILVATANPHYAILGLWTAGLAWWARDVLWPGRKRAAIFASAVLILAAGITARYFVPEDYSSNTTFNVIFSEILPNSSHPDRDLAELGLDSSYRRWSGVNAFAPESPLADQAFVRSYLTRTSYRKLASFYLRHPAVGWHSFRRALDDAGRMRIPMGNFDVNSGQHPRAETRSFVVISDVKKAAFFHHGSRLLLSFVALAASFLALLAWNRDRLPKGAWAGGLVLAAMSATNLVVSAMGEVFDPTRHLLIFFAQYDLLLLATLWLAWFAYDRPPHVSPVPRFGSGADKITT
jgi:hypothetical protein